MNTALVLYGQPRFFELTYKHFFSYLIEELNADVFFHTWWSKEMVGTLYPCAQHAKHALDDEDLLVREDTIIKLNELYKPVRYHTNDYENVTEMFGGVTPGFFQYYTQFVSKNTLYWYQINSGKKYDLIIRSRFDLMVTQEIDFQFDDSLWVASCCPYSDGRVNDMFSISNYDIFNKITDAVLFINDYAEEGQGEMEWPLARQIEKHNIPVRKFNANYSDFDILRSSTAKKYK